MIASPPCEASDWVGMGWTKSTIGFKERRGARREEAREGGPGMCGRTTMPGFSAKC